MCAKKILNSLASEPQPEVSVRWRCLLRSENDRHRFSRIVGFAICCFLSLGRVYSQSMSDERYCAGTCINVLHTHFPIPNSAPRLGLFGISSCTDIDSDGYDDCCFPYIDSDSEFGSVCVEVISAAQRTRLRRWRVSDVLASPSATLACLGAAPGSLKSAIAVGISRLRRCGEVQLWSVDAKSERTCVISDVDYINDVEEDGCGFGLQVCSIGDVNGDAVGDVCVSSPARIRSRKLSIHSAPQEIGCVDCYNGRDGALLWESASPSVVGTEGIVGLSLCQVGDLDGDGVPDIALGIPPGMHSRARCPVAAGSVRLLSGHDGRIIRDFAAIAGVCDAGWQIGAAGDLDSDGHSDVIIAGGPRQCAFSKLSGRCICAMSSSSGSLLWRYNASPSSCGTGVGFAIIDDRDGDGVADVASGEILAVSASGVQSIALQVLSGMTGQVLATISGPVIDRVASMAVCSGPDIDGDGGRELVILVGGMRGGGSGLVIYSQGLPTRKDDSSPRCSDSSSFPAVRR
jgi:hypothetical protein